MKPTGTITQQFKKKEFDEIPASRIMEIQHRINPVSEADILETWVKHYKSQGIPFIVTQQMMVQSNVGYKVPRMSIWKERRV